MRAANEGEENYDYTHRCFSKVVDFSNGVSLYFSLKIIRIYSICDGNLPFNIRGSFSMVNRLFIIILGIMRKKILVCAIFVFLKCVTNKFKYYSNKIIPKNKSVNYNFFFF